MVTKFIQFMFQMDLSDQFKDKLFKLFTFLGQHYTVLNGALEGKDYLVGNMYTLADAVNFPFVRVHFVCGIPNLDDLPNLKAWIVRIYARPAVQRGLNVPDPDRLKEIFENPEKLGRIY